MVRGISTHVGPVANVLNLRLSEIVCSKAKISTPAHRCQDNQYRIVRALREAKQSCAHPGAHHS